MREAFLRFRSELSRARHRERSRRMQDEWREGTASRHWQSGKNSLDDGLTRHRFGLSFVADDDAMAQHVGANTLHILWRNISAPVQERMGARSECKVNGGARRCAIANQSFETQIVGGWFACRPDDVHDVIFHAVIDVDVVNELASSDDLFRLHD